MSIVYFNRTLFNPWSIFISDQRVFISMLLARSQQHGELIEKTLIGITVSTNIIDLRAFVYSFFSVFLLAGKIWKGKHEKIENAIYRYGRRLSMVISDGFVISFVPLLLGRWGGYIFANTRSSLTATLTYTRYYRDVLPAVRVARFLSPSPSLPLLSVSMCLSLSLSLPLVLGVSINLPSYDFITFSADQTRVVIKENSAVKADFRREVRVVETEGN